MDGGIAKEATSNHKGLGRGKLRGRKKEIGINGE